MLMNGHFVSCSNFRLASVSRSCHSTGQRLEEFKNSGSYYKLKAFKINEADGNCQVAGPPSLNSSLPPPVFTRMDCLFRQNKRCGSGGVCSFRQ